MKSESNVRAFRLGELFCGPGGLALGAINAAFSSGGAKYHIIPAWASDYDKDTCETYIHNIAVKYQELVICKDVRELDIKTLPAIDAFAYGFPCNDFSIVGERKGFQGTFGPLYSYGVAVLTHFKPKFFVAENVGGMRSANAGNAFQRILADLGNSGNGYQLTVHYYKFEQYGIPQTRHRLIIVGIDKKYGLKFRVPAPCTADTPVSVKEALKNIPRSAPNQELTSQSNVVVQRLKYIKPGQNAWNAEIPKSLQLNVKGAKLSQIYRR